MKTLLTSAERRRTTNDARVAARFQVLREQYPDATKTRIAMQILKEGTCGVKSYGGVRNALIRAGVWGR